MDRFLEQITATYGLECRIGSDATKDDMVIDPSNEMTKHVFYQEYIVILCSLRDAAYEVISSATPSALQTF